MIKLTKTDFIQFLKCPKSLWWLKHKPDSYPHGEFSVFLQKLTREGYEVERYVRQYFENARREADYQAVFETGDGLFARADVLERLDNGEVALYEIKSSTSVKKGTDHNHIKDACFQKICAERSGQNIDNVFLVHLNGDYVRAGDIDPEGLLTFADVTEEVRVIQEETEIEINAALILLAETNIDPDGCTCMQNSRAHHCDTFTMFNPGVPQSSIYSLPRLSAKKRYDLVVNRLFKLDDVPDDYPLTGIQQTVVIAAKTGKPQINRAAIHDFLSEMVFPLYFFDYETFASAVPLLDRMSPHKHFPVQYSLHILDADGQLTHREFLESELRLPDRLIRQMEADIGAGGSIVSWHASFEKARNRDMALMFPEKAEFLIGLNDRMVDLEDVFKSNYVDARFDGSTSIKKVLPVICPELNYEGLDVQDGASAMEAWQRMIGAGEAEANEIAKALLSYCELDTLAMVEIYKFLNQLVDH